MGTSNNNEETESGPIAGGNSPSVIDGGAESSAKFTNTTFSAAWGDSFTNNSFQRMWGVLRRTSFYTVNAPHPPLYRFFMLVLCVLELLQLVLMTLVPVMLREPNRFSERGVTVVRYFYDPTPHNFHFLGTTILAWSIFGLCSFHLSVFCFEILYVLRGGLPHARVLTVLKTISHLITRVLVIPGLSLGVSLLRGTSSAAATTTDGDSTLSLPHRIVAGLSLFAVLIPISVYSAMFHTPFLPSRDMWAMSTPRLPATLSLTKIILVAISCLEQYSATSRAAIVFVLFFCLSLTTTVFLPFYKRRLNMMVSGVYAGVCWSALLQAVACWVPSSGILYVFIIQVVGAVVSCCLVHTLTWFRMASINKKIRAGTPSMSQPYQADWLLKFFLSSNTRDPVPLQLIGDLFALFRDKFPTSGFVYYINAVYLMEGMHDPQGMLSQSRLGCRMECLIDIGYLLSCCSQYAHDMMQEESGLNSEIVSLMESVTKNQKYARHCIIKFWDEVDRKRDGLNTQSTFALMSQLDMYYSKVQSTLEYLLQKYPTNSRILRMWALFQEELRNDEETSTMALNMADDVDTCNRKRQRHNNHHRVGHAVVMVKPMSPPKNKVSPEGGEQEEDQTTKDVVVQIATTSTHSGLGDHMEETASIASSAAAGVNNDQRLCKKREYRRHLENTKSQAVIQIHVLFLCVLAIMIGLISGLFGMANTTFPNYLTRLGVVNSTVHTRAQWTASLYWTRFHELHPTDNTVCPALLDKTASFIRDVTVMWKNNRMSSSIGQEWQLSDINMRYFVPSENVSDVSTGARFNSSTTLWDGCISIVNSFNALCNPEDVWYNHPNMRLTPHFRLAMDNIAPFSAHFTSLGNQFAKMLNDDVSTSKSAAIGIFSASAAVFVIGPVILLLFGALAINKEHRAAAKFFREIPRSSIVNIKHKLGADDEKQHDQVAGTSVGMRAMSLDNIKATWWVMLQAILAAVVLLGLAGAMFGVITTFCVDHKSTGDTINHSGIRRAYIGVLRYYGQELAVRDPYGDAWSSIKTRFNTMLNTLYDLDQELKYDTDGGGIVNSINSDPRQMELWYTRPCPTSLNLTDCVGLSMLLRRFIDELTLYNAETPVTMSLTNTHLVAAISLVETTASWLTEAISLILEEAIEKNNEAQTGMTVIMVVSWLTVPVLYAMMWVILRRSGTEIERLIRMLVFVPVGDLDDIKTIREFLEGQTDMSALAQKDNNSNNSAAQQNQETKNLLDGSSYGVLIIGPLLTIEMVNPAAELLSGFQAQDLLGQPITHLIPTGYGKNDKLLNKLQDNAVMIEDEEKPRKAAKQKEVTLRTKKGRNLQALISVSKSTIGTRTSQALFIQDISELKQHEEELVESQQTTERFLCNILPKQLVKQLAGTEAHGSGFGSTIIAQTYEEVTVLFADIVQFTNLSSGRQPEELVEMLNSLVSEWDKLALELGVEKIKTIGDCYMACAGVPTPFAEHGQAMLEFAIGMLEIVDSYNKSHPGMNISIRVGMNTGPAVAGVLGIFKMQYDLWGETVASAERMESASFPNRIQLSETTYQKVKGHNGWEFESRGKIAIKGHGDMEGFLFVPSSSKTKVTRPKSIESGSKNSLSRCTSFTPSVCSELQKQIVVMSNGPTPREVVESNNQEQLRELMENGSVSDSVSKLLN